MRSTLTPLKGRIGIGTVMIGLVMVFGAVIFMVFVASTHAEEGHPSSVTTVYLPMIVGCLDCPDPKHRAERDTMFAWLQTQRKTVHYACADNPLQRHPTLDAMAQEWAELISPIPPKFVPLPPDIGFREQYPNARSGWYFEFNSPRMPPEFWQRYGVEPKVQVPLIRTNAGETQLDYTVLETHRDFTATYAGDPYSLAVGCARAPVPQETYRVFANTVPIYTGIGMTDQVTLIVHAYAHDFPNGAPPSEPVHPAPYTTPIPPAPYTYLRQRGEVGWAGERNMWEFAKESINMHRWFWGCPTPIIEHPVLMASAAEWSSIQFSGKGHSTDAFGQRYGGIGAEALGWSPSMSLSVLGGGAHVEHGGHYWIVIACNPVTAEALIMERSLIGNKDAVTHSISVSDIRTEHLLRLPPAEDYGTYRPCRPDPDRPGHYLYDHPYFERTETRGGMYSIRCAEVLEAMYTQFPHKRP